MALKNDGIADVDYSPVEFFGALPSISGGVSTVPVKTTQPSTTTTTEQPSCEERIGEPDWIPCSSVPAGSQATAHTQYSDCCKIVDGQMPLPDPDDCEKQGEGVNWVGIPADPKPEELAGLNGAWFCRYVGSDKWRTFICATPKSGAGWTCWPIPPGAGSSPGTGTELNPFSSCQSVGGGSITQYTEPLPLDKSQAPCDNAWMCRETRLGGYSDWCCPEEVVGKNITCIPIIGEEEGTENGGAGDYTDTGGGVDTGGGGGSYDGGYGDAGDYTDGGGGETDTGGEEMPPSLGFNWQTAGLIGLGLAGVAGVAYYFMRRK